MSFKTFVAAAAAVAGLIGMTPASRADVIYALNATFDDGTPLTGTFSVNVYGYVDSLDLTTVDGAITGYVYTNGTAFPQGGCPDPFCFDYGRLTPPYLGALQVAFNDPLGSVHSDSIISGEGGPSWENYSYTEGAPPIRYIASGVATAIPEPATWAMLLLGFAGLGYAGYRGRRSAVAAAL